MRCHKKTAYLVALFGILIKPIIGNAAPSCNTTFYEDRKVPVGDCRHLWNIDGQAFCSVKGGMRSISWQIREYQYQTGDEELVAVVRGITGDLRVFTRHKRGFSLYLFDKASEKLSFVFSKELWSAGCNSSAMNPLVDLVSDGSDYFLLTSFNVFILSDYDLKKQTFNPKIVDFPSYAIDPTSGQCDLGSRAVGWIPMADNLFILRKKDYLYDVPFNFWKSSRKFESNSAIFSWDAWRTFYVNLLPTRRVQGQGLNPTVLVASNEDNNGSWTHYAYLVGDHRATKETLPDFAIASYRLKTSTQEDSLDQVFFDHYKAPARYYQKGGLSNCTINSTPFRKFIVLDPVTASNQTVIYGISFDNVLMSGIFN